MSEMYALQGLLILETIALVSVGLYAVGRLELFPPSAPARNQTTVDRLRREQREAYLRIKELEEQLRESNADAERFRKMFGKCKIDSLRAEIDTWEN